MQELPTPWDHSLVAKRAFQRLQLHGILFKLVYVMTMININRILRENVTPNTPWS